MSKQAIIGINGSLTPFSETVDKLRTPGIGGSDIIWVPEDQTRCESLRVTANGTYAAASAGKYGYNYVTVSVAGDSVTGKDGDGDESTATVDPETGIIEYTKIPSSIEITTPPTKLIYTDGETIDFTGAVVKAYLETGGEYGTVPNGEITLNPTTAVYDSGAYTPGGADASYDGDTSEWPYPAVTSIPTGSVLFASTASQEETFAITGGYIVVFNATGDSTPIKVFSTESGASVQRSVHYPSHPNDDFIQTINLGNTNVTYNGTTYYYASASIWQASSVTIPSCGMDETQSTQKQVATILFDGEITIRPAGSPMTITVSWPRPGDGAILETSFNITVTPASQEE